VCSGKQRKSKKRRKRKDWAMCVAPFKNLFLDFPGVVRLAE
jgi:hypothetical protein